MAIEMKMPPLNDPTAILSHGPWEKASFRLPRAAALPCEVKLRRGPNEIRSTVAGDWRDVTSWGTVELGAAALRRLKREQAELEPAEG